MRNYNEKKKYAQRSHSKKRFKEYYGYQLSREKYKVLIALLSHAHIHGEDLEEGDWKVNYLKAQTRSRVIYEMTLPNGLKLYPIFDPLKREIRTFLTKEMVDNNTWEDPIVSMADEKEREEG